MAATISNGVSEASEERAPAGAVSYASILNPRSGTESSEKATKDNNKENISSQVASEKTPQKQRAQEGKGKFQRIGKRSSHQQHQHNKAEKRTIRPAPEGKKVEEKPEGKPNNVSKLESN